MPELLSGSMLAPHIKVESLTIWNWGASEVALDVVPLRGISSTGSGRGATAWALENAQVPERKEPLGQMVAH